MKRRNYVVYIEDILESMDKIERYIKGLNFETFIRNELIMDAVLRNLEIILIIVTTLVFLIAFVTGGLLSFDKPVNNTILAVHKVAPFFIVASGTLIIYILARGK